jgi:hypothetical protein
MKRERIENMNGRVSGGELISQGHSNIILWDGIEENFG